MAYFPPYIDPSGLHFSTYTDLRDWMVSEFRRIYGSDTILGNDTQDYQLISTIALMIYDTQQGILLAYNNSSPATAVGTGLARLVRLNGLTVKIPTPSRAVLLLTGTPQTVINAGVVRDVNGNLWDLPDIVTIGDSGTVRVTASCRVRGPITALQGDINIIVTQTLGWVSVTNEADAIVGDPGESDSELRARQARSTYLPSQTVFEGIWAGIEDLEGVTRVKGYENPNDEIDADGVSAHSIYFVVEGGEDNAIANEIFVRKTPGTGMDGDITVTVSSTNNSGSLDVKFSRPTDVNPPVVINITKLATWSNSLEGMIKEAVVTAGDSINIGEDVYPGTLIGPVLSVNEDQNNPSFYVTALTVGGVSDKYSVGTSERVQIRTEDISVVIT